MAKKNNNPEWVKELNAFLEEFKNRHPEAKVNLLAGDGTGYMCVIDDLEVWAGGLYSALLDAPLLVLPTHDALQKAVESMKGIVKEAREEMKNAPQMVVPIRTNNIKS